jgi:hypothetical protein
MWAKTGNPLALKTLKDARAGPAIKQALRDKLISSGFINLERFALVGLEKIFCPPLQPAAD